jgi:3'-phosphoadenosine 5'-phosphosulfate (PAPS) 3'-phosphatase
MHCIKVVLFFSELARARGTDKYFAGRRDPQLVALGTKTANCTCTKKTRKYYIIPQYSFHSLHVNNVMPLPPPLITTKNSTRSAQTHATTRPATTCRKMPDDEPFVTIGALLDASLAAAADAVAIVRTAQRQRMRDAAAATATLAPTLKEPGNTASVCTTADVAAQHAMVRRLRRLLGERVRIVGEEDDAGDAGADNAFVVDDADVHTAARSASYALPASLASLNASDVTVFVDPIDGTREFMHNRTHAVSVLVGVAYRGRAICGVLARPLPPPGDDDVAADLPPPLFAYGCCGSSDGLAWLPKPPGATKDVPDDGDDGVRLAISKDLGAGTATAAVLDVLDGGTGECHALRVAACGYKIYHLLTGAADVCVFNLKSSLWDSCATEALVRCAGGKLTNLLGLPIEHSVNDDADGGGSSGGFGHGSCGGTLSNLLGVVATAASFTACTGAGPRSHAALCTAVAADARVKHLLDAVRGCVYDGDDGGDALQAFDVSRTIGGAPISVVMLQRAVFDDKYDDDDNGGRATPRVKRYWADESDAVRYKQSAACRLRWCLVGNDADNDAGGVTSAFYKRIVMRELPYAVKKLTTAPFKLARDVRANVNEATLLSSPLAAAFNRSYGGGGGVNTSGVDIEIALPYTVQCQTYADVPIDSRFSLLLRDFSAEHGWRQYPHLNTVQLRATLDALASWHAYFWLADDNDEEGDLHDLAQRLWPVAGYWDLHKSGATQVDTVADSWQCILRALRRDGLVSADGEQFDTLGESLRSVTTAADAALHGVGANSLPKQTILHGDAKAANFFFRCNTGDGDAQVNDDVGAVGVIDFQWTGAGVVATDIAYLILAAADPSALFKEQSDFQTFDACVVASGDAAMTTPTSATTALERDDVDDASAEEDLLRFYHERLDIALAARGRGHCTPPLATLREQYCIAFVDQCRVSVTCHWNVAGNRETAASPPAAASDIVTLLRERQACRSMVFNACNKNLTLACWMLRRLRVYLDDPVVATLSTRGFECGARATACSLSAALNFDDR